MKVDHNGTDSEEETMVMQKRQKNALPLSSVIIQDNYISNAPSSSQKSNVADRQTLGSEPAGPEKEPDDVKSRKDHGVREKVACNPDLLQSQIVTKSDGPHILYDHYFDADKSTSKKDEPLNDSLPHQDSPEESWQSVPFMNSLAADCEIKRQQRGRGYTEVQAPKYQGESEKGICQNRPFHEKRFKIHSGSHNNLMNPQPTRQPKDCFRETPSNGKAAEAKGADGSQPPASEPSGESSKEQPSVAQKAFVQTLVNHLGTGEQKDILGRQKSSFYGTATGTNSSGNNTLVSGSKKPRTWTAEFSAVESSSGLKEKVAGGDKEINDPQTDALQSGVAPEEQKINAKYNSLSGLQEKVNSDGRPGQQADFTAEVKGASPLDLDKTKSGAKTSRLLKTSNFMNEGQAIPPGTLNDPSLQRSLSAFRGGGRQPSEASVSKQISSGLRLTINLGHTLVCEDYFKEIKSSQPIQPRSSHPLPLQAHPTQTSSGFKATRLQIRNEAGQLVDYDGCSSPIKGPIHRHFSNQTVGASPGIPDGSGAKLTPPDEKSSQSFSIRSDDEVSHDSRLFYDKDNQKISDKGSLEDSDLKDSFLKDSGLQDFKGLGKTESKAVHDLAELSCQESEDVDGDSMIEQGEDITDLIEMVQEYNQTADQRRREKPSSAQPKTDSWRQELQHFLRIADSIERVFGQVSDHSESIPEEETQVGAPERVDLAKQSLAKSMWDEFEARTRVDQPPAAALKQAPTANVGLNQTILKDRKHDLAESEMVEDPALLAQSNIGILEAKFIQKTIQEEDEEELTNVEVKGHHAFICEQERVVVSPEVAKELLAASASEDTKVSPQQDLLQKTYTQRPDLALAQSFQVTDDKAIQKDLLEKSALSDSCSFKSFSQNIGEHDEDEGESTVLSLGGQDDVKVVILEEE